MRQFVKIGEFQGFPLSVSMGSFSKKITATLSGGIAHRTELIGSYVHNLKRLENTLYSVDTKIADCQSKLSRLRIDYADAEKLVNQPFAKADELAQKEERLTTLTNELNAAAAEMKRNKPQQQTCYFERAKLKKEAAKLRAEGDKKSKTKSKQTAIGDE